MKHLNVAMIGYKFMGKAHTLAMDEMKIFFPDYEIQFCKKVICGRNEAMVAEAAGVLGWEEWTTDIEAAISRPDIDVVDIASPTCDHKRLVLLAAKHKKHIICEKPLAFNAKEAQEMTDAVQAAGVKNMVAFNVRHTPAVLLAKQLIEEGRIGKPYHFRGHYLQDWAMDETQPLVWRFQKAVAGSGTHGDLNAHLIDMARFLVGELGQVTGMMETFVKQRPVLSSQDGVGAKLKGKADMSEPFAEVDVDDACAFLARFKDGALGTFEATRFAGGNKNVNGFEVNGSKGSVRFNFERLNELEFWSADDEQETQGYKTILVTEDCHPYTERYWPAGHMLGFANTYLNEFAAFSQTIAGKNQFCADFYDGLQCNKVLQAVEESVKSGNWVKVDDML